MGNGRKAIAPCGHTGEIVVGTYVQCALCDRDAVPTPVRDESTRPICRKCGGDVERVSAVWWCGYCTEGWPA